MSILIFLYPTLWYTTILWPILSISRQPVSINNLAVGYIVVIFLHHFTDRCWFQTSMLSILDIYRWRTVNWINNYESEMNFIARIWPLLDHIYSSTVVQTWRYFWIDWVPFFLSLRWTRLILISFILPYFSLETKSIAEMVANNQHSGITGMVPIDAKVASASPDLTLYRFDM